MVIATSTAQSRLEELEVLAAIGRVVSSSLEIDEIYESFVDLLQRVVPFDRVAVVFLDVETDQFVEAVVRDLTESESPQQPPIPSSGTFIGRVAEQQQTEVLQSHHSDMANMGSEPRSDDDSPGRLASRFDSLLAVPLVWRGTSIGLLTLRAIEYGVYGPHEVELANEIGNQISGAIATQGAYRHELALAEARRQSEVLAAENSYLHELDQSKTRLLATTSHELKTPLAVIRGFADALMLTAGENFPESQMVHLDAIVRNCDRLNKMINGLLDSSQLESGKVELVRTRFDLGELMKDMIHQFEVTTRSKQQVLELSLPSKPIEVEADRDRLVQIIINLLDNASKYSPPKSTIELSATADENWVCVVVKDDGMGIPLEARSRVFEYFERGDQADVAGQSGLGLGLPLVKSLVVLHGGMIEIGGNPGFGTEVTVSLPK